MDGVTALDAALLVGGGVAAGVVNTLAGGGSLLTVPLLVLIGLPGTLANGTNRVGILLQCLVASWRFHAQGMLPWGSMLRVAVPVVLGALAGASGIARISDTAFERLFGVVMLVLLVPTLRRTMASEPGPAAPRWGRTTSALTFFGIGVYTGAIQAGVGIPLLFALIHVGHDVVRANAIKMAVIGVATLAAVPVFAVQGQIAWLPAVLLACGFSVGAVIGPHLAIRGGERAVRPVLVVAVLALAARMLGVF
jgi:uncharacterized membrane protein YfcA